MISYAKLFKMLEEKGISTYVLRHEWGIGGATVQKLQRNETVSTNTIERICRNLNCKWEDIAEYIPDDKEK